MRSKEADATREAKKGGIGTVLLTLPVKVVARMVSGRQAELSSAPRSAPMKFSTSLVVLPVPPVCQ